LRSEVVTVARILIIAYTTYFHDGRVKRHAESLAERGDHVDVICLKGSLQGDETNVSVIGLEMPRYRGASRSAYFRSYLRFFGLASLEAIRRSRVARYDVVVVCTMPDAAVLCALGPKLMGSKIVLDIHDTMPELYQDKFGGRRGAIGARLLLAEERASAWFADRVLAVHDLHRRRLEQAGVPGAKINVVMNLPDPRIFAARNGNHRSSERFTVVCHGTVTRRLGLDVAISATHLLRDRIPGLRLMVMGGGDFLEESKRLADSLNLDGHVTFSSPVLIERLPEALAQAAVGVVPNRASSATNLMLPVKMLEYAVLEIPIIAARLRTIEHYFDEKAVRFFRPGDARDLAEAIEELYLQPNRRAALVRNAKNVANRLNWENQRREYYATIDSLLAEGA
jgi:glycosyltransferase involved in cell wall biosynthesis